MTAPMMSQRMLAALLCMAIALWAAMPAPSHIPAALEVMEDHAAMVADHGHSHGLEEDLAEILHGHGHDAADHDHGSALLVAGNVPHADTVFRAALRLAETTAPPAPDFASKRPPRA